MQTRRVLAGVCLAALFVGGVRVARKLWASKATKSGNNAALLADGHQTTSCSTINQAAYVGETVTPMPCSQPSPDTDAEYSLERPVSAVDGESADEAEMSSVSSNEGAWASDASSESAGDSNCKESSSTEVPDDWEEWYDKATDAAAAVASSNASEVPTSWEDICTGAVEVSSPFCSSSLSCTVTGSSSAGASYPAAPLSARESPAASSDGLNSKDASYLWAVGCGACEPTGRMLGTGAQGYVEEVVVKLPYSGKTLKMARKVLFGTPEVAAFTLEREVASMRAAASTGCAVKVYGYMSDLAAERFEYIMELVEGGTLDELLATFSSKPRGSRALTLGRTQRLGASLLRVLKALHSRGMAHLDLKPANVMLSGGSNDDERFLVTDFGMTAYMTCMCPKSTQGVLDHRGGTAVYMSPEMSLALRGKPGHPLTVAADMPSVGAILALSAAQEWGGNSANLICFMGGAVSLPDDMPYQLQDLVMRLTAQNPEKRPTAAEALNHAFFSMREVVAGPPDCSEAA